MRGLPGPGIELMPPALAGVFFTNEPSGKSRRYFLSIYDLQDFGNQL